MYFNNFFLRNSYAIYFYLSKVIANQIIRNFKTIYTFQLLCNGCDYSYNYSKDSKNCRISNCVIA
jgi:hypothetical protein